MLNDSFTLTKSEYRRSRKKKRRKQKKINNRLKARLFGHLAIAPCYYCRRVFTYHDLTIEHITPLCLGGTNEPSNITLACAPYNHERGKIAWRQKQQSPEFLAIKRERAKQHYEQYSPEYRSQNG
jgi:5-methylcytosine-specific restriction endonuclease McrA